MRSGSSPLHNNHNNYQTIRFCISMGLFKKSAPSRAERARAAAESSNTARVSASANEASELPTYTESIKRPPSKSNSTSQSLSQVDRLAKKAFKRGQTTTKNDRMGSPIITDSRGQVGSLYAPKPEEMERRRRENCYGGEGNQQDFVDEDGEPWVGSKNGRRRLKEYNKNQPPPGQGPCQTM